jgi:acyl-CoA synthetase (AMP-forming)/AMP-acid ligase II
VGPAITEPVLLTAADAERLQALIAGALLRQGVERGQRVALVDGDGSLDANRLCFIGGALRVGIIPVVLNAALTRDERDALLEDAQAARTLSDHALSALADAGHTTDLAPAPLGRPMLYTSGTTGVPKGVWTGVLSEDEGVALQQEERDLWHFDAADRHLVCGNSHHSAPVRFALGTLAAGGDVILPGKFDAPTQLAALREFAPTSSFMAPVHLHRLLDLTNDDADAFASFRMLAHAGAPCSDAVKHRALKTLSAGSVWEFYGATEGQFTACGPDDWLAHPGSVGPARPGRRLHVDDDGLIWCAPPSFARFEYWNDPAKTAAAWRTRDGVREFTVGDLGRLDDEGFLYLDGRRDDLILSGGVNVYPAEIEKVLLDTPGVDDGAVFPREDDAWGQRVCAVYVGAATEAAVRDALRARLAGYKQPKELHRIDDIPRSANGKIRRAFLATELGLD